MVAVYGGLESDIQCLERWPITRDLVKNVSEKANGIYQKAILIECTLWETSNKK